jgi:transcriptional regulator with XRE-family HTH domain
MPLDPDKLRAARRGRTTRQIAALAEMPQPAYVRFETGYRSNPTLLTAERIAAALGVPLADLLFEKPAKKRPAK